MNFFLKPSLFPSDYHLVNLRTLNDNQEDFKHNPSKNLAFILRRFAYDCDENYDQLFHFEQVRFYFVFFYLKKKEFFFSQSLNISFKKIKSNQSNKLLYHYDIRNKN